jgi:hypothetical protein
VKKSIFYIVLLIFIIAEGCKEPYEIETGLGQGGFLVVDGYINVGDGVTTINLSRTTPIDEVPVLTPETGATVAIEDGQFSFPLTESSSGVYVSEELQLPLDRQYRLRIITNNENVYLSEFTNPISTPPIDSVTWKQEFEGVEIAVTTHDPSNKTHFYRWEFDEVWELQSFYRSFVKYENSEFIFRSNEELKNMYQCWKYDTNSMINISSSQGLTSDIIASHPITFIPSYERKLAIRYRILVKQHALSADAYDFFRILLKNNENLGTFSDPQPSELPGNIQCLNANEVVVGFVEASTTETSKLFINRIDLYSWNYIPACEELELLFDSTDIETSMRYLTPTELIVENLIRIGVKATYPACADCRVDGGINLMPPFWNIEEE